MDLLETYSQELENLKNNEHVLSIIIFGSYSTDKVTPLSDLDVCILTKKNISKVQKREILSSGDENFDLSLFEDLPLSLQVKILTAGIIYFTSQDLSDLKNKTLNNWFDFRVGLNKLYKSRGFTGLEI